MIQDLKELTSNILETMFYLTEETEPLQMRSELKYAVNIKNATVDILLIFSEKTAKCMAENFLGTDEITDHDIEDTLKEAINIITGNFIRINMNDKTTKIEIPQSIKPLTKIEHHKYETASLYYKEEQLKILLKMG